MRDFLKNAAALLIGLLLSAGLLEIGLRLANFSYRPWFRPDPVTGARHVAGAEEWVRKEGGIHQWAGEDLAGAVCKLLEQGAGRASGEI